MTRWLLLSAKIQPSEKHQSSTMADRCRLVVTRSKSRDTHLTFLISYLCHIIYNISNLSIDAHEQLPSVNHPSHGSQSRPQPQPQPHPRPRSRTLDLQMHRVLAPLNLSLHPPHRRLRSPRSRVRRAQRSRTGRRFQRRAGDGADCAVQRYTRWYKTSSFTRTQKAIHALWGKDHDVIWVTRLMYRGDI